MKVGTVTNTQRSRVMHAMDIEDAAAHKTLSDIYGHVSREMLDSLLARNNMTLGAKYAMRDAHFHPQKTLAEFRRDMAEYGLHPHPGPNIPREIPAWAARARALPPDALPHQVYDQYPEGVLVDEGW